MKTPKFDELSRRWKFTDTISREEANCIMAEVAEGMRAECESAWQDGWAAGRESPVRLENPYAKRKDG